jgi:class 3 adenylate cyclase
MEVPMAGNEAARVGTLRPWQRLGVRLAVLFALVTVLGVGLVGEVIYLRQRREVEDSVGTQLLNIARVATLLVDPTLHAEVAAGAGPGSPAYRTVQTRLSEIRSETLLPGPIYTVTDLERGGAQARIVVTSQPDSPAAGRYPVAPEAREPLAWAFQDGVARYTRIYGDRRGMWISAFGPIVDGAGHATAALVLDYPVEIYLDRLRELQLTIVQASLVGALVAGAVGLLVARRITRPVSALTAGVGRVAGGDLSQALAVRSADEIGQLTRAFNGMLEGLRQRDFIRDTFGRYVSPEVARTLLESPDGLALGGQKRVVTILMSDLRGYTRFAEQGDPAWVMEVLNGVLGRMAEIIIAHGGTINEFIGDAIFAVFGAPVAHPDHAERAAGAALAMQRSMAALNDEHAARGLPRFEMGIGVNTGEAVVGNIGSARRAKYAVVGSAVNVAARVEASTVGGQVYITAATRAALGELAETAPPVSVEVKGLAAPLVLHELRALRGRFAQRLPGPSAEREIDVALPVRYWVLDGKAIRGEARTGVAVRLGRQRLTARLSAPLAPLTDVRLRLQSSPPDRESGDIYGKVVDAVADEPGLTAIHLTSVDVADARWLQALVTDKQERDAC